MNSIQASYSLREKGTGLIAHEKTLHQYRELCDLLDHYPWERELAITEREQEGGGFFFLLGDERVFASYQFIPVAMHKGFLLFELVLKPGTLGLFGRKSLSLDFDVVTLEDAKLKLRELFESSVASLYERYKT